MKFISFVFCFVILSQLSFAEDRPNEDSMFGAPAPAAAPKKTKAPKPAPAVAPKPIEKNRDAQELNSVGPRDAFASGEVADNALQVGGKYFQRFVASPQQGVSAGNTLISAPMQFDGYLDVRPNDRLRGFLDARLFYDPTRDQYSRATNGGGAGSIQFSSTSAAPSTISTTTTTLSTTNPMVALDSAWLKFDVGRTVFATVGKQHVKWGPSRFWNPTDFLNPQRRDPLLGYDLRLGNMMAKFELPWEAKRTNFYAIALFDNPEPASSFAQMGGAFRVESVVGGPEIGLDMIVRGGRTPVYGADISTPLGPFDGYAEVAYFPSSPNTFYQINSGLTAGANLSNIVGTQDRKGPFVQASAGINYTFAWTENRQATAGIEYFYNQLGYDDAAIYPALIFFGQYQPFYTARHYGAFYVTAEGPDAEKKTNFTFSTLGNFSDLSFISRLDFSWRVLTYLTFEAYADVHYGNDGGEFNFSLNTPTLTSGTTTIPAISIARTTFDVGLGLRLSF